MTTGSDAKVTRSYGCSMGCGNPYDYVLLDVSDGTSQFLCLPCFLHFTAEIIEAVNNPSNPDVQRALAWADEHPNEVVPGPSGNRRGKNAPATNTDQGVFEAYDSAILVDELPDEFR